MLLASAVNVALGWGWHTYFRIRHQWTWRREGALAAAALVAAVGLVETVRSPKIDRQAPRAIEAPMPLLAPAPALTASATPPVTETQPLEIVPTSDPVATVAAAPSPQPDPAQATQQAAVDDPIGAKIMERLGDPDVATGSIPEATARPKPKPARTVKPVKADHRKP